MQYNCSVEYSLQPHFRCYFVSLLKWRNNFSSPFWFSSILQVYCGHDAALTPHLRTFRRTSFLHHPPLAKRGGADKTAQIKRRYTGSTHCCVDDQEVGPWFSTGWVAKWCYENLAGVCWHSMKLLPRKIKKKFWKNTLKKFEMVFYDIKY